MVSYKILVKENPRLDVSHVIVDGYPAMTELFEAKSEETAHEKTNGVRHFNKGTALEIEGYKYIIDDITLTLQDHTIALETDIPEEKTQADVYVTLVVKKIGKA